LAGHPQIVSTHVYDAVTGWLSANQTGVGSGAALQNESYLYDEDGNLMQRQNNNPPGLTENFIYDGVNRLSTSHLGTALNLSITYDVTGNILSRSDVASGSEWTYDPVHKHQVTQAGSSAFTYAYDANGNVISRNGSLLSWTSFNYPSGVSTATESATFDYGPNHQRWRMVYSGSAGMETTYYATPLFEVVLTSSPTAVTDYRHYIYANGRPVVVISRTTAGAINVHSLLLDHQGSISTIVADATGTAAATESFSAFGNRREAATWSGSPTSTELAAMNGVTREGYTFQTVLGSMGLNHMNGRIEDSVTGRFLSPDPVGTTIDDTQSWNRYTYVLNNPLSFTDPSGFTTTCGGSPGTHYQFATGQGCGGPDGSPGQLYNQLEAQEVASNITIPGDASTDALFGSLNWLFGGNTTVCVQNCGMLRGGSIDACDPISGDCTTTTFEPQPDPSAIYVSLQNLNGVPSIGGTGSSAARSPKSPAQSNGSQHQYQSKGFTSCSGTDAFNAVKDASAPGAPPAQEDFTSPISLPPLIPFGQGILPDYFTHRNPIAQLVSTPNLTLTNIALDGHVFFPGQVVTTVTPSGAGSVITTVGTGSGDHAIFNDTVGGLYFGLRNFLISFGCSFAGGASIAD